MGTKVASSSWLITIFGVVVIWALASLTLLGFTPFGVQTGMVTVLITFVGIAFLASEVFMEGKVKSLKDLQTDTVAAFETVLILLLAIFVVISVIMGGIPTSMRALMGVLGILGAATMVYEIKR